MSHSITLAFGLDFVASSVSTPFLAPEHPPRSVKEGASLGASSRPVYSPESNAVQRDDAKTIHPSRSPTSGSPTSVAPSRATADGTSTTLGARSSGTYPRRTINAYLLFRTHYLEELRKRGDIAFVTTNDKRAALLKVGEAWHALSYEERDMYWQEAREMKARLAQEHLEIQ
ncbi:hypothetical protein K523DRAFT_311013 [Schizophyllum commune Tattone D]|nr:hypothetical protein K523DRAFT_311013 [Schizophyllum commune Tattone D]